MENPRLLKKFVACALIFAGGLLIASNVKVLRWIYLLTAERTVFVGEENIQLDSNFFLLPGKDPSTIAIGGFSSEKMVLPTGNVIAVSKYSNMQTDVLAKLKGLCSSVTCKSFVLQKIGGTECAVLENIRDPLSAGLMLNIYCPFPQMKIMVEYRGAAEERSYFEELMIRLIKSAQKAEAKTRGST